MERLNLPLEMESSKLSKSMNNHSQILVMTLIIPLFTGSYPLKE